MIGVTHTQNPRAVPALRLAVTLLVGGALGAGIVYATLGRLGPAESARAPTTPEAGKEHGGGEHAEEEPGVVHMPKEKWANAEIEVAPARRGSLTLSKWVTGRITPNQDRLSHVYSLVEGIVHEVNVQFGQRVQAGGVLAVIDSKEIGAAKLDLVKDRQAAHVAAVNKDWAQTIRDNTRALLRALEQGTPPQQIAEQFRDRPMGEYREKLVSAYALLHRARADYDRQDDLFKRRIVSEKDYLRTKAEYEAAQATYDALREQIKFTSEQQLLQAQQALEGAKVAEGASRSALLIMGYREKEVAAMDPLSEGEEVAHYVIAAPFEGTITSKDVVIDERVGPDTKLFDLADLSTVWVQADIFEKDLPVLAGLKDQPIRFRVGAYPDRRFEARLFYTGDIVDETTRTVRMTAVAENPEGLLKPGLFAEVELPIGTVQDVVQVPPSALQQAEGQSFVFVHRGGEEFERRAVTVGREGTDAVEITAGLEAGDPVAIRGTFALKAELMRGELAEGGHAH